MKYVKQINNIRIYNEGRDGPYVGKAPDGTEVVSAIFLDSAEDECRATFDYLSEAKQAAIKKYGRKEYSQ